MAKDVSEPADRPSSLESSVLETDPVGLRTAIAALDPVRVVWAEPGSPPVVAAGIEGVVTGTGPDRFRTVKQEGQALLDGVEGVDGPGVARPRLYGGFSFFEAADLGSPWEAFDPAAFVLPAIQIVLEPERTLLTGVGAGIDRLEEAADTIRDVAAEGKGSAKFESPEAGSTGAEFRTDRSDWMERVRTVRDRIRDGDLEKAVLSAAYDVALDGHLPLASVMGALETRYPDCYRFSFSPPRADRRTTFFGASPERLVTKRDRRLETEALAGTVERGDSPDEDERRRRRLQENETLAREHAVVADRIREQLTELGADVQIGDRTVRTLENVHHLKTPMSASLPPDVHVLDLVATLHPTPALGGHPREAARSLIAEVESTVRGWYGAPIGWFDATGNGSFAVGIRSALARDGTATLYAGNGIVAGSDPETEYRELAAKFEPIREVLP